MPLVQRLVMNESSVTPLLFCPRRFGNLGAWWGREGGGKAKEGRQAEAWEKAEGT
jgi:hypothetical protein